MKWIDVKEDMPDDDMEVLVAINGKDWCFATHDSDRGGWVHLNQLCLLPCVTHWMDLEAPEVQP